MDGTAWFYPYGDEITNTANDREKFVTYTRDSYTGLDYADQRFYASTYGRFNTPDPYQASGGPSDPSSWNQYAYTRGDLSTGTILAGWMMNLQMIPSLTRHRRGRSRVAHSECTSIKRVTACRTEVGGDQLIT